MNIKQAKIAVAVVVVIAWQESICITKEAQASECLLLLIFI